MGMSRLRAALVVSAVVARKGSSLTTTTTTTTAAITRRRRRRTTDAIITQQLRRELTSASSPVSSSSSTNSESSSSSSTSTTRLSLLADRLSGLDQPTVWHEFSPLAVQHGAVNLGQGFPDWDPPAFCQRAMERSVDPGAGRNANQYARSAAHLPLANVLVEDYNQRWNRMRMRNNKSSGIIPEEEAQPDLLTNPETQVATAVGCTQALYCALMGLVNEGDEVLLLEPAFDIYIAQVRMAGGTPIFCPLRTAASTQASAAPATANEVFALDLEEFESKITPQTKAFILNTPHNPTGKMFTRRELEGIAAIVRKYPHLTVIADEVYEHIVFDDDDNNNEGHLSFATIPGMFGQTLTLSSAGKTFSMTGWKVGWAVGPANLVKCVTAVQQWVNFSAPTPNQDAVAQALVTARDEPYQGYDNYYAFLAADYQRKRGILMAALEQAGLIPVLPPGGFFIMADTSRITEFDEIYEKQYKDAVTAAMPASPMPRDWAMSRWMTETVGVTAIPPSAFYEPQHVHLARNYLRFAFCKGDDTIEEAARRLEAYFCSGTGSGG